MSAPVVMFPDDDALWFPHMAASVMGVYERDTEGLIGGVGGTESPVPPPGVLGGPNPRVRMEARDRLQLVIGRFLDRMESSLFPDPFFLETRCRYRDKQLPPWLEGEKAVRATVFPGFRMSFRTDVITRTGFDETLGRYALFEDYDACLGVLDGHVLVDSTGAWVFHHRSPEKRVNGLEWGVLQVLNRAYVICKHTPPGSLSRRRLRGFSYYKLARYLLQAQSIYGRERVRGVMRAVPSYFFSAPDPTTGIARSLPGPSRTLPVISGGAYSITSTAAPCILPGAQAVEGLICSGEREQLDFRPDGNFWRQSEKLLAVLSRQVRHRPDEPFLPQ